MSTGESCQVLANRCSSCPVMFQEEDRKAVGIVFAWSPFESVGRTLQAKQLCRLLIRMRVARVESVAGSVDISRDRHR
jgi:hypothetical protein